MKREDLTSPQKFSSFIGEFWRSIFDNGVFCDALGFLYADQLSQVYQDLLSSVSEISSGDVDLFKKDKARLLRVNRVEFESREVEMKYGTGLKYGASQNADVADSAVLYGKFFKSKNQYAIKKPEKFAAIEPTLIGVSSLLSPDTILVAGIDFTEDSKYFYFRNNIFDDLNFQKEVEVVDGKQVEFLHLWFVDTKTDNYSLYKNFGVIYSSFLKSTQEYKDATQRFLKLLSFGPSRKNIEAFLSCAAQSPVVYEDGELVESISNFKESTVFTTDKNVYVVSPPQKPREDIEVGDVLSSGTPLSTAVVAINPKTEKKWWKRLSAIPVKSMFTFNPDAFLSFPNKESSIEIERIPTTYGGPDKLLVKFNILGQADLEKEFWSYVKESLAKNPKFSFDGFVKRIESLGVTIHDKTGIPWTNNTINPAQVFGEEMAQDIISPVFIDFSQIKDLDIFFSLVSKNTKNIDSVYPIYSVVQFFGSVNAEEEIVDLSEFQDSVTDHGFLNSFDNNTICISPEDGILEETAFVTEDNPSSGPREKKRFAIESVLVKYRSRCTT